MRKQRQVLRGLIACAIPVLLASVPAGAAGAGAADVFPLEIDHLFLWVTKGAPEAGALEDAGLQVLKETTRHAGQGTASKGLVFENAYLELIWIDDEQAASENAGRTGIDWVVRANWKRTGASPFGVGLHHMSGTAGPIPFPVMEYRAEWMEANTSIQFARVVSNPGEPMYFVVPDSMAVPDAPTREKLLQADPEYAKMVKHRLGIANLTSVKIAATEKDLSSTAAMMTRSGVARIERGKAPLMELTFDDGAQKKILDLRPHLPLIIKY